MSKSVFSTDNLGAIVLCGGRSERMGFPKWKLPINGRTMLEHILHSISRHVSHTVVAAGNEIIELEIDNVDIVRDEHQNCGPMEGIRSGLKAMSSRTEFAFVTACDTPFFVPEVVRHLLHKVGNNEAAIPKGPSHIYGMSGVYRTASHSKIDRLIKEGKLRVSELANVVETILVPTSELQQFDRELRCVYNINRPTDYFGLLDLLGQDCPEEIRLQLASVDAEQ